MGRTVWMSQGRHVHIHDTPQCPGLRRARSSYPVVERPLAQVLNPVPCKVCWPKAPRLRVWHQLCTVCKQTKPLPCPHNGAVLVNQPRRGQWTGKFGDSKYDPDSVTYVHRWVWPENAFRYTLVNPGQ